MAECLLPKSERLSAVGSRVAAPPNRLSYMVSILGPWPLVVSPRAVDDLEGIIAPSFRVVGSGSHSRSIVLICLRLRRPGNPADRRGTNKVAREHHPPIGRYRLVTQPWVHRTRHDARFPNRSELTALRAQRPPSAGDLLSHVRPGARCGDPILTNPARVMIPSPFASTTSSRGQAPRKIR